MAFTIRDLSVLAYANGFTLWHYKAGKESLDTVSGADFFAGASDMMTVGDMVMVSGAAGGRVVCVAAADTGSVITAPMA